MKFNSIYYIANLFFLFRSFSLIQTQPTIPTQLKIEEITELKYSTLTKFYYYVDLSQYKEKEESILTLHSFFMSAVKKFHASYISDIPVDKLMEHMPIEKSDFKTEDSEYEGYKFLYFQNHQITKPQSYLLVYLEMENVSGKEDTATIVLSDHEKTSFVTEKTMYARVELSPYIPKILKYLVVKDVDFGDSYLFYFPIDNYQTVFEGELLDDKDAINPQKTLDRLVTFTFPSDQPLYYNLNITIVLFGPQITATLEIWNTFSSVKSFHERKKDQMFQMEVVNSFDPFYILGSYQTDLESMIYFERLYGDFNLYYKNYINGVDLKSVLPSHLDRTGTISYIKSSKKHDLIMGECSTPCGFNVYFVTNPQPSKIAFGEKLIVYLTPEKEITITVPDSNEAMNIEIQNIERVKDIEVRVLGSTVPYFEFVHRSVYTPTTGVSKTIILKSKVETIVSVLLGTAKTYTVISNTDPNPKQNSIYYFENDLTISSIQLDLTNLDSKQTDTNKMVYFIGYGIYPYIQDPIQLVIPTPTTMSTTISASVTTEFPFNNPYLQNPPFPKEDGAKYYFLFSFEKEPNFSFEETITRSSQLSTIEEKTMKKIANLETFALKPVTPGRSLLYYIMKCSKEESIMKFKYGTQTINGLYVTKQFTAQKYDNPFNYLKIEFGMSKHEEKYPGVLFYYAYPTIAEAANIQFNDDFEINYFDLNDNSTEIEMQFTSPLLKKQTYDVIYDVYVYHKQEENALYDICRADTMKSALNVRSKELKVKTKLTLDRTKENYVFITAIASEGISLLFSYKTIHLNLVKPPDEPKAMSYVWWIVIGLGAVIIILVVIFVIAYQKKKANKPIDPMTVPNEALI